MDNRTQAERDYDAQRDGSAYVKPEQTDQEYEQLLDSVWARITSILADADPDPAPNLPADLKRWIDRHVEEEQAQPAEQPATLMLAVADFIAPYEQDDAEDTDAIIEILRSLTRPANATPEQEFAAGVAAGQAIGKAIKGQSPADVDRDYEAGRAGALMTLLYRALDDRRADDLVCLIEKLLDAAPAERTRIVDSLLAVE